MRKVLSKQEKLAQVKQQIDEKLSTEIRNALHRKAEQLFVSGGIPSDEYLEDGDFLATMAILNSYCTDNPYAPRSPQSKKEFKNINHFI